jgi:hypothetical protein
MSLTDTAIRRTKCFATPQKLRDGNGLYLLLRPDGARWWRYDYLLWSSFGGHVDRGFQVVAFS